jgi:hypothetical protein
VHHLSHELRYELLFLIVQVDHEDVQLSDQCLILIQCNDDGQRAITKSMK